MRERPLLRVTAAGGPVEVALPESPTTGYRWQFDHDPAAVAVLGTSYAPDADQQGQAGGGGTRTFQLELLARTSITLDFFLRRSPTSTPLEHQPIELTP